MRPAFLFLVASSVSPPKNKGTLDLTSSRGFELWLGICFSKRCWDTLLESLRVGAVRAVAPERRGTWKAAVVVDDQVRLVLPADASYGRVARITASSLALRLGFSFVRIDDLRLAIDEALVLLLASQPLEGTITLWFTVEAEGLAVDLLGADDAPGITTEADVRRFEDLVIPLVDLAELQDDGRTVHLLTRFPSS